MKNIVLCDDSSLLETVALCEKYRLGIEVQSFFDPEYLNNNPDGVEIHNNSLKNISNRSFHGPFADLSPGSFDSMIRDVARNRFEYAYNNAIKIGAKDIIFHHGYMPATASYDGWLSRSVAFWKDYLEDKNTSIRFYIENIFDIDPALILDVVKEVGRKNFNICLDIGHVHWNSNISVIDWIKTLNKHIGYVHMHDNHGQSDEHLGFGKGSIPILETCEALEQYSTHAIWAIETNNNDMEDTILWLMANGYLKG